MLGYVDSGFLFSGLGTKESFDWIDVMIGAGGWEPICTKEPIGNCGEDDEEDS